MHEYGKTNWELLWEKLEQEGNIGIDYVINPYLYPRIISFLAAHPKSIVVDFGCGTNFMGIQLLFGYKSAIAGFQNVSDVDHARFNTLLFLGVEGSKELVDQANRYLADIGNPRNIGTVEIHIGNKSEKLFDANTVDLCTSRNFLMHLTPEDFEDHMSHVADILKAGGSYIFATLNPAYELLKAGRELVVGERYDFLLGKSGEHGTFYHFYKSKEVQDRTIEKYFDIEECVPCLPVTDKYSDSHSRYYDPNMPMAYVYSLKVKK